MFQSISLKLLWVCIPIRFKILKNEPLSIFYYNRRVVLAAGRGLTVISHQSTASHPWIVFDWGTITVNPLLREQAVIRRGGMCWTLVSVCWRMMGKWIGRSIYWDGRVEGAMIHIRIFVTNPLPHFHPSILPRCF